MNTLEMENFEVIPSNVISNITLAYAILNISFA